jgi:secretion/DNA translocation related TadE-like protein
MRDERGAATVLALGATAVLVAAATAVMVVTAAVTARHRAGAAADLAALAAAVDAVHGPTVACRSASQVATADGGRLTACRLTGPVADVTVAVPLRGFLSRWHAAVGRARAGPA